VVGVLRFKVIILEGKDEAERNVNYVSTAGLELDLEITRLLKLPFTLQERPRASVRRNREHLKPSLASPALEPPCPSISPSLFLASGSEN
jgi:hypothetical protein